MTYIKTKMKKEISIDSIITIHYFEYSDDFIFNERSHDFWEFLYIDHGEVFVYSYNESITLRAGDIMFYRPNELHSIISAGEDIPNLITISFSSSSPALKDFFGLHTTLSAKERSMIFNIISEANRAFSTPLYDPTVEQVAVDPSAPFGACQLIILYLEQFLIMIWRNHLSKTSEYPYVDGSKTTIHSKTAQFEEIIDYMQKHICDRLTVPAICDKFSISRSSLQSLFHTQKGCGTIEYFNQIKIEYAKEIIRSGTMNFTEISQYLSYSSLQYFSKQFKKTTGMSPLAYSSSVKAMSKAFPDDFK